MASARGFDRLAELERSGEPFALATVVGRRAPVSAVLGDRAVIFADGRMEGFVGGACARDIILSRALGALRRGRAQLVSIRPGLVTVAAGESEDVERVVVPMGCASEGEIDIYIEPHLPQRRLVVIGFTPVAEAVARVGVSLDYHVTRFVQTKETSQIEPNPGVEVLPLDGLAAFLEREGKNTVRLSAVVASQGHYDETALERLLAVPVGYVGLLASRKRMDAVRGILLQSGVAKERLEQVHNPIGLDIGAHSPGEIALAILSEIVTVTPQTLAADEVAGAPPEPRESAVDPVCGMDVDIDEDAPKGDYAGVTYYFCCEGCARKFAADPQRYAGALERA
jgi:xanthine dehydrogenase accessory factor